MPDPSIPAAIVALADARAMARAARDWPEADRLRAEIERAGWKVVDRGFSYRLGPAHPPDIATDGVVRYGRSAAVPSRLEESPTGLATVVLVATDWPDDLARTLVGLRAHGPTGTQVVVVADGPTAAQDEALARSEAEDVDADDGSVEVVRTSARLGQAAALNIGIRRAAAPVVIVLDTSIEPTGDLVTPLVRALDDPTVAVAGGWGMVSTDLRRFVDAPAGDVDAVEGCCQAFRRADAATRGPLDEHFRFHRYLDVWWSLVLRDEGAGRPPRRALALADLPTVRHELRGYGRFRPGERDRLSRRDFYRIFDRFGRRSDLLSEPATLAARS